MAQYGTRKTHNGYETGIVSGYVYDPNTSVHYSGSPTHFKEEFSFIGLWTSTRSVYDDVRNYYIHAKDYYGEGEHLYIQKGTGYYIFEGASGEGVRWFGRFPFRPDFQDSNGYWHEKDHGFIWDSDAPIPFYNYGKVSDFERSDGVRYIDPDGNGVFTKAPIIEPVQNIGFMEPEDVPAQNPPLINPDMEGNASIELSDNPNVRTLQKNDINEYINDLANSGEYDEVTDGIDQIAIDREPRYLEPNPNQLNADGDEGIVEEIIQDDPAAEEEVNLIASDVIAETEEVAFGVEEGIATVLTLAVSVFS